MVSVQIGQTISQYKITIPALEELYPCNRSAIYFHEGQTYFTDDRGRMYRKVLQHNRVRSVDCEETTFVPTAGNWQTYCRADEFDTGLGYDVCTFDFLSERSAGDPPSQKVAHHWEKVALNTKIRLMLKLGTTEQFSILKAEARPVPLSLEMPPLRFNEELPPAGTQELSSEEETQVIPILNNKKQRVAVKRYNTEA